MDNEFDPIRFQGRWYEIGRYPSFFEAKYSSVTIDYSFNSDKNTMEILNTHLYNDILMRQDSISAILTNLPGEFLFKPDENMPFITYKIIETDYNNYAFIGNNNFPKYYHILSRRDKATFKEIIYLQDKTIEFGFDPSKVEINYSALLD